MSTALICSANTQLLTHNERKHSEVTIWAQGQLLDVSSGRRYTEGAFGGKYLLGRWGTSLINSSSESR